MHLKLLVVWQQDVGEKETFLIYPTYSFFVCKEEISNIKRILNIKNIKYFFKILKKYQVRVLLTHFFLLVKSSSVDFRLELECFLYGEQRKG